MAVNFGTYEEEILVDGTKVKAKAITCYLVGFQKTKDGERTGGKRDFTKIFSAVESGKATVDGARRRRKG